MNFFQKLLCTRIAGTSDNWLVHAGTACKSPPDLKCEAENNLSGVASDGQTNEVWGCNIVSKCSEFGEVCPGIAPNNHNTKQPSGTARSCDEVSKLPIKNVNMLQEEVGSGRYIYSHTGTQNSVTD